MSSYAAVPLESRILEILNSHPGKVTADVARKELMSLFGVNVSLAAAGKALSRTRIGSGLAFADTPRVRDHGLPLLSEAPSLPNGFAVIVSGDDPNVADFYRAAKEKGATTFKCLTGTPAGSAVAALVGGEAIAVPYNGGLSRKARSEAHGRALDGELYSDAVFIAGEPDMNLVIAAESRGVPVYVWTKK